MSFQLAIPRTAGGELEITLDIGQTLFVLGANGTGKSSLMQRVNRIHTNNARWVSAHRQNWFESDSINLSPQAKRETEQSIRNFDVNDQASDKYRDLRTCRS
jgi:ABC-type cobalamin/Fe3+-siderophores transport system ATPase subunit